MVEKPKRKSKSMFAALINSLFHNNDFPVPVGYLLTAIGIMVVVIWMILPTFNSGQAQTHTNQSYISNSLTVDGCTIGLFYNSVSGDADKVMYAIDCDTVQFARYSIQLTGRVLREYGEVPTAIHWFSGEGTYFHDVGFAQITDDTTDIWFSFEPEGSESFSVNIDIR